MIIQPLTFGIAVAYSCKQFGKFSTSASILSGIAASAFAAYALTPGPPPPKKIEEPPLPIKIEEPTPILGISNNNNNICYLSASLQAFFHTPSIRKVITSYTKNDEMVLKLKSFITLYENGSDQETLGASIKEIQTATNKEIPLFANDLERKEFITNINSLLDAANVGYWITDEKEEGNQLLVESIYLKLNEYALSPNFESAKEIIDQALKDRVLSFGNQQQQDIADFFFNQLQALSLQDSFYVASFNPGAPQELSSTIKEKPLSDLLVVNIPRRLGNEKDTTPITLPANGVVTINKKSYKLKCIIEHVGTAGTQGHYVAHIRRPDGTFILADDDKLTSSDPESLKQGSLYLLELQP